MLSKEEALKGVKLFVLDMDGTFYLGDRIIDGALDFIHKVEDTGRKFLFFTNNASRVSSFYKQKLAKMGLEVDESDVVTAGDVTIEFIKSFYPGKRIYLNGTPLLEQSFLDAGINLVQEDPDVVIQSFDKTLTYEKLEKICTFVRNGVPFLATHMDTNCPTEDGFIPDCGETKISRKALQGNHGYGSENYRLFQRGDRICRRSDLHRRSHRCEQWGKRLSGTDRRGGYADGCRI